MKINRLLAIVTYLLNRDVVSCKDLSEKFEVSERTIQRDIDTINLAGIPIISLRGVNGGYKIMDSFKLSKQTSNDKDLKSIALALRSLNSALEDQNISTVLEKVVSVSNQESSPKMNVDFSVAKENKNIVQYIKIINQGINKKLKIKFSYTNSEGQSSSKITEPVLLQFKWYSWYLVAYNTKNERYQIFKLVRMKSLELTDSEFYTIHNYDENLFDKLMINDNRKYINIYFKCNKNIISKVSEYLPATKVKKEFGSYYELELSVPENEHMWFAMLLSFGDDIEIISPDILKKRIIEHSKKIIDKYKIPDR